MVGTTDIFFFFVNSKDKNKWAKMLFWKLDVYPRSLRELADNLGRLRYKVHPVIVVAFAPCCGVK